MSNLKNKLIAFALFYFTVPLVFYSIDMVCQETFYDGGIVALVPLTITLTWLVVAWFGFLLRQGKIKISSPISAVIGASVGLLHFFTIYMMVGTFWVWKNVPAEGMVWTWDDTKYMLIRAANPFADYYLMYCDGSLLAMILSIVFFIKIGIDQNKKLKDA